MTQWRFMLRMNSELHAEMRVFQIVNNQQLSMLAFSGRSSGEILTMTFTIKTDGTKAKRIEALLYHLQPILYVDVSLSEESDAQESVERMGSK